MVSAVDEGAGFMITQYQTRKAQEEKNKLTTCNSNNYY
jgi:hypothetical protein